MKTGTAITTLTIILVITLALLLSAAKPKEQQSIEPILEQPKPVYKTTHQINITHFRPEPNHLTINLGDKVVFTNMNGRDHKIQEESFRMFESPWLQVGESYQHTFTQSGEFRYELLNEHSEFRRQRSTRRPTTIYTGTIEVRP